MNAAEVKEALRRRHNALEERGFLGPWTCLEEFASIGLLALSAWSSRKPPIVGYEVKVSRSDYRRELLNPSKRALAVAACWEFYMATPAGLLTDEEKAYVEPEHFEDGSAFVREPCTAKPRCGRRSRYERRRGMTEAEEKAARLTGHMHYIDIGHGDAACWIDGAYDHEAREEFSPVEPKWAWRVGKRLEIWVPCRTCEGRGYMRKSVAETEAPTLWVPADVGLIEITGNGCRVVRKAPREEPTRELGPIGHIVRWASFRPDPRHSAAP